MAAIANFITADEISTSTIATAPEKAHKDQHNSNGATKTTTNSSPPHDRISVDAAIPLSGALTSKPTLPDPLPLKNRIAIVTGGSGGIGSAICTHLAALGARVVVSYLGDPSPADTLLLSINSLLPHLPSPRAVKLEADVSDESQVKYLFDQTQHIFGPTIHILVATAGLQDSTYPYVADTCLSQWERVFDVNAKGTFLCCREAARRLVRGGGGRIITMSSSTVGAIREGYGCYSATKAAVEVMTRVMAKELKGTGITANAVAPGPVRTAMFYAGKTEEKVERLAEMSPMGRVGEPGDVAPVVGFLATDDGGWVNGQVIRINGGYV